MAEWFTPALARALRRRIGVPERVSRRGGGLAGALVEYSARDPGAARIAGIGGRRELPPVGTIGGPPSGGGLPEFVIGVRQGTFRSETAATLFGRRPLRELHRDRPPERAVSALRGMDRLRELDFAQDVAEVHREQDFLRRLLRETEPGDVPPRTEGEAEDVTDRAARFARSARIDVDVAGRHYSGLSNAELLDILAAQGRDFLQTTEEMRAHVQETIASTLGAQWDEQNAREVAAEAVREWIVQRFERQGVDVDLAPLDAQYRAWKSSSGYSTKIGIKTGALLGAVKSARVRVT